MKAVIVDDSQASAFLNSIWSDMLLYIKEHPEEYQEFVESENHSNDPDSQTVAESNDYAYD